MSETVIALYDTLDDANNAIADLVNEGFNRSDIGLIVNAAEGVYTPRERGDVTAREGAGVGALAGGITGLVVGLAALTIPGIGPIVAAGPLVVALGGAAVGAVTGGLAASLIDLGVPENQVDYYSEAIRRGSPMVTVIAEETRVNEAMRILGRHNPYDIEHRAKQWRQQGWKGHDASSDVYTGHDEWEHTHMPKDNLGASATLNENRVRRYTPNTPR